MPSLIKSVLTANPAGKFATLPWSVYIKFEGVLVALALLIHMYS